MQHITSHHKLYEYPTWTDCRSPTQRFLTSSKGHRLDSMRRWASVSFRSLLGGLPEAGGDTACDGMGLMASTLLMTTWQMLSMASVLEMASRLPSPSHLPRDSWSCISIFWCRTKVCAVLQQAAQQITHETAYVFITASKQPLTKIFIISIDILPDITPSQIQIHTEVTRPGHNKMNEIPIKINIQMEKSNIQSYLWICNTAHNGPTQCYHIDIRSRIKGKEKSLCCLIYSHMHMVYFIISPDPAQ